MKNIARATVIGLVLALYYALSYPAEANFWMPGLSPGQTASGAISTPLAIYFLCLLLFTALSAILLLGGITVGLVFDRRGYWLMKKSFWLLLVFGACTGGLYGLIVYLAADA